MSQIQLAVNQLALDYPIYGSDSASLRHRFLKISTGGKVNADTSMVVIRALNKVSFSLQAGDRLGLVGHNGAGKSSLLRVLAGVYTPSEGSVQVSGKIGTLLDLAMGMEPEATGYENIRIRGMLLGLNKKEIEAMVKDVEAFVDMGDFLSMPVKTYSAGMSVRLAFAMSTSVAPDILLIDEALGAGDAAFMQKAKDRMKNFLHQSKILVLASHSFDSVKQFCNKALWLEHGNLKGFGSVDEIVAAYRSEADAVNKPEVATA